MTRTVLLLVGLLSGCAIFPDCVGTPFCTNSTVLAPDYGTLHGPVVVVPSRGTRNASRRR